MFCEFENTNLKYNNKDIYVCKYCGIKLLLDNPEIDKILCFAKQKEISSIANPGVPETIDNIKPEDLNEVVLGQAIQKLSTDEPVSFSIGDSEHDTLCSPEEINDRLKICNSCEYYKDSSCLLCGCTVVREKVYNNKLAQKNQHCPIFKWKAITDN